jgi:UDP-N-acetylglucosamine 2-epimerase
MKILIVVGARPQFIEHFSMLRGLRKNHTKIFVHAAQNNVYFVNRVFSGEVM